MASLTIRNLNKAVKEALRVRAAQRGRSMEEEARIALSSYASATENCDQIAQLAPPDISKDRSFDPSDRSRVISAATDFRELEQTAERTDQNLCGKDIVLVIGGGIAAYKALELIRRLRRSKARVYVIMTEAAQQFVTPLAAGALSAGPVHTDLFSRNDEQDIGHIRLARTADLIIVAPATANRLALLASGFATDLAAAVILATRAPILLAPAMNPAMWSKEATVRNYRRLINDGFHFVGPERGEMAESGEAGLGRMSEPSAIVEAAVDLLAPRCQPLQGKHVIVTSGPTHEAIDPVRYIANRSSGKQGHAVASALAKLGAEVTLISGPVALDDPQDVNTIHVTSAEQMFAAVKEALPADAAVLAAAVADWRSAEIAAQKIKKQRDHDEWFLKLLKNDDILAFVGTGSAQQRPKLVVGFAAETIDPITNGQKKLHSKGADLIVLNDVSADETGESVMGADANKVFILEGTNVTEWPKMSKVKVAEKLAYLIAERLNLG